VELSLHTPAQCFISYSLFSPFPFWRDIKVRHSVLFLLPRRDSFIISYSTVQSFYCMIIMITDSASYLMREIPVSLSQLMQFLKRLRCNEQIQTVVSLKIFPKTIWPTKLNRDIKIHVLHFINFVCGVITNRHDYSDIRGRNIVFSEGGWSRMRKQF